MVKLLTIDSSQSKDLDDAIWLTKTDSGYCLDVYIADVANEIGKDTPLDVAAKKQAFSIYRGHRGCTKPMFPRDLSENHLSLLENQDRKAMGIHIALNALLDFVSVQFTHADVNNTARLNPELADELMHPDNTSELSDTLRLLKSVSTTLLNKRRENGALAFYDITKRIYINEDGHLVSMTDDKAFHSQIIVQETMLLANAACAEYFVKNDLPGLYRNHRVGSAAPLSAAIAADIDLALRADNPSHFQMLSRRLDLIMSKATVDRILHGHYALNLPAYAYFTSPIRRYPDLVNQRILFSHIKGLEVPYTNEELDEIAAHYNDRALAEDEAESEKYRGLSARASSIALERNALSRLDETEFYRVIRYLTKEQLDIPNSFYEEWASRLRANTVSNKLIAALIGGLGDRLAFDCSTQTMGYLRTNRPIGTSVWEILESKHGFIKPSITISGDGELTGFTATAEGVIFDKPCSVKGIKAKTKKAASQKAYIELLSVFLGVPYVSKHKQGDALITNQVPVVGGENYKGQVLEWHMQAKKPHPQFSVESSGEAHAKQFLCTIRGGFAETNFVKGEVSGSKKEAEQSASKLFLQAYKNQMDTGITDKKTNAGGNPISALQEYCQKQGLVLPNYTFKQEGQVFACHVHIPGVNEASYVSRGISKSNAKGNAASALLSKLIA